MISFDTGGLSKVVIDFQYIMSFYNSQNEYWSNCQQRLIPMMGSTVLSLQAIITIVHDIIY